MRSYRGVICFLVFLIINTTFSQNNDDSVETVTVNDSLDKVYYYFNLASDFKNTNLDLAIFYNKKALKLANKIKSPDACAITNELMGELFEKGHNIQPSINYYLISARIYETDNDEKKLADVYSKLAGLYYNDNFNLEKAHIYYDKALGLAVKNNNRDLIAYIYNRIGGIFFYQSNYDESLDYYIKALDIWRGLGKDDGIARSLNNMGEIYRVKGDLAKALDYYQRSFEINKKINEARQLAVNLENIGMIYSAQGNTALAFEFYQKSLNMYSENSFLDDKIQLLILMGKEYLKIGLLDKSLNYLMDAYNQAKHNNDLDKIAEASLGISSVYEQKSRFSEALKYYRIHSQANDSIVFKQKLDQLAIMQTNFLNDLNTKEIELKDNQIKLYEKQQRIDLINYRFMVFVVLVIIISAVLIVWRQRMQAKEEMIIRHKNMELQRTQQELMKAELKSKDRDLVNFAVQLIQKNKVLRQLKSDLKTLSSSSDDETARKLRELSLHVKRSLQMEKEMEEFQRKVDRTYSDFFVKLRKQFPALTKNDERLCAMLRLNLTSKEIATLNNITIKAVEMSRYRLRKKCNIQNTQDLSRFMNEI